MKIISMKAFVAMFVLLAIVIMTSCEKDKDTTTTSEVLTDGNWRLTGLSSNPAYNWFGTPVTNIYAQLSACIKDDNTIFNKNGVVNFDEGDSKCASNAPQTKSGIWTLSTDEKILSLTTNGYTERWNIEALDDKSFIANYQIMEEGLPYTFTFIFNKD